jgi:hypothetical protein
MEMGISKVPDMISPWNSYADSQKQPPCPKWSKHVRRIETSSSATHASTAAGHGRSHHGRGSASGIAAVMLSDEGSDNDDDIEEEIQAIQDFSKQFPSYRQ